MSHTLAIFAVFLALLLYLCLCDTFIPLNITDNTNNMMKAAMMTHWCLDTVNMCKFISHDIMAHSVAVIRVAAITSVVEGLCGRGEKFVLIQVFPLLINRDYPTK